MQIFTLAHQDRVEWFELVLVEQILSDFIKESLGLKLNFFYQRICSDDSEFLELGSNLTKLDHFDEWLAFRHSYFFLIRAWSIQLTRIWIIFDVETKNVHYVSLMVNFHLSHNFLGSLQLHKRPYHGRQNVLRFVEQGNVWCLGKLELLFVVVRFYSKGIDRHLSKTSEVFY